MGEFAPLHWLVVLVVVMIFFGPKKLPEIGKALGEGIREFKKAMKDPSAEKTNDQFQNPTKSIIG